MWVGDLGYSSSGICYYMSDYVQENTWSKHNTKSYADAVKAAEKVVPKTIITAALAKNCIARSGDRVPQNKGYKSYESKLSENCVYRLEIWFGGVFENPSSTTDVNHECIIVTGTGTDVVYLDPNWGFYKTTSGTGSNLSTVIDSIEDIYIANREHAENFRFRKIRRL